MVRVFLFRQKSQEQIEQMVSILERYIGGREVIHAESIDKSTERYSRSNFSPNQLRA